jgi:hypothetical protein
VKLVFRQLISPSYLSYVQRLRAASFQTVLFQQKKERKQMDFSGKKIFFWKKVIFFYLETNATLLSLTPTYDVYQTSAINPRLYEHFKL